MASPPPPPPPPPPPCPDGCDLALKLPGRSRGHNARRQRLSRASLLGRPSILLIILLLATSLKAQLPTDHQGDDDQRIGPPDIVEPLPAFEMRPEFPQEPQSFMIPAPDADLRPGFRCFTLNTASTLMEPGGITKVAGAKPLMNFGFHAGPTIETQILLPPTSVYYLPLPRFPMNDGCAFQQGASPASGCELTGVPFTEHPAGGFTLARPFSNTSHCQLFSSCIPKEEWEADPRHRLDPGSQGQWCAELGGCYQPATGVKTNNGCVCYSDRPLREWYGENVTVPELPPKLDGDDMYACTMGWMRLMGGTRCGFTGFGQLNQRPTGHVIRDRGEGKQDNPALKRRMLSSKASESLEQDSASFVFRRHPACITYNASSGDPGEIRNIQPAQGKCLFEGQVQLAARVLSDEGEPEYSIFATPLNHSIIYTLRLWPEEKSSLFELIAADGTTVMEARRLTNRRCFNYKQGRNLGLSRLPLTGSNFSMINRTCTYMTPVQVCYASDPHQWGVDAWKRTAGQGLPQDAFNSGMFSSPSGAKCIPPHCTPHSGGGVLSTGYEQFRFPAGG